MFVKRMCLYIYKKNSLNIFKSCSIWKWLIQRKSVWLFGKMMNRKYTRIYSVYLFEITRSGSLHSFFHIYPSFFFTFIYMKWRINVEWHCFIENITSSIVSPRLFSIYFLKSFTVFSWLFSFNFSFLVKKKSMSYYKLYTSFLKC